MFTNNINVLFGKDLRELGRHLVRLETGPRYVHFYFVPRQHTLVAQIELPTGAMSDVFRRFDLQSFNWNNVSALSRKAFEIANEHGLFSGVVSVSVQYDKVTANNQKLAYMWHDLFRQAKYPGEAEVICKHPNGGTYWVIKAKELRDNVLENFRRLQMRAA